MSMKFAIAVAMFAFIPVLSQAQNGADSVAYRRAQTLVNDGNATAGRAIVDSLISRATPGTNAYAEGLYWRAVLSATASGCGDGLSPNCRGLSALTESGGHPVATGSARACARGLRWSDCSI
jgi:hypothetical protein